MSSVSIKVLATVNAPYGTNLSAAQLASKISSLESVGHFDPSAFSFFSEVDEQLQYSFIDEMSVNLDVAAQMAHQFSKLAGYPLALDP